MTLTSARTGEGRCRAHTVGGSPDSSPSLKVIKKGM